MTLLCDWISLDHKKGLAHLQSIQFVSIIEIKHSINQPFCVFEYVCILYTENLVSFYCAKRIYFPFKSLVPFQTFNALQF